MRRTNEATSRDLNPFAGRTASAPSFKILDEIGQGARSIVYRVEHDGAMYALKVFRSQGRDDGQVQAAFCREASFEACVNHPGVPQVHDVGEIDGHPYI